MRINPFQRVGMTGADKPHCAQTITNALHDFRIEGIARCFQKAFDIIRGQGQDQRGRHAVDRQESDGLAFIKPLRCNVMVWRVMRHAADQHGAFEIMNNGPDSGTPTGRGEAPICPDNQLCLKVAFGMMHHGLCRVLPYGFNRNPV